MSSDSKPRLYYMLESPPCRTVMAIARLIGVELELKKIDLSKKEQLNEEFVKVRDNVCHYCDELLQIFAFFSTTISIFEQSCLLIIHIS